MTDEHGRCPRCDADLNGGSIFEHFLAKYGGDRERALETASQYGATETDGRWGRVIGIEDGSYDGVSAWAVPRLRRPLVALDRGAPELTMHATVAKQAALVVDWS